MSILVCLRNAIMSSSLLTIDRCRSICCMLGRLIGVIATTTYANHAIGSHCYSWGCFAIQVCGESLGTMGFTPGYCA